MKHRAKKILLFLIADIILIAGAMIASFLLRFDGEIPAVYRGDVPYYIIISVLIIIPLLFWRRLYSFSWSFVSLNEIIDLFQAIILSALFFWIAYYLFQRTPLFLGFPRSIIIVHHALAFLSLGGLRSAKRISSLLLVQRGRTRGELKNTLIIGAGERADEFIRTLYKEKNGYNVIGILDSDPEKKSTLLHKIKVLGSIELLQSVAAAENIETIIIALSDAENETIKRTVSLARESNITDIKIVPTLYEVLSGNITAQNLRPIQVEDLLGRRVARIETEEISRFIKGKTILVTGAAGSIGSELSKQIIRFDPKKLYLLDQEESNLFDVARSLEGESNPARVYPVIADIRNKKRIKKLFKTMSPHIIFHAAAYKHVPLMEEFPQEAIATNILGTLNVSKAAVASGTKKCIIISTDKAVRPISIMGKTKKLAEMIGQALNSKNGTQFVSVRFGNVLGSRGSVLSIFQDQIKRRKPVTVTDPRMARYFMTAPEACLLVLEAASSGEGGEIFVLDMGKPVKIVDLAKELIRLSGLEPDRDIPIVYTMPRKGEKLFEDIFNTSENMTETMYQKIFRAKTTYSFQPEQFLGDIENLKNHLYNSPELLKILSKLAK